MKQKPTHDIPLLYNLTITINAYQCCTLVAIPQHFQSGSLDSLQVQQMSRAFIPQQRGLGVAR